MPQLIVSASILVSLIFYATTAGADFGGGIWDLLATEPRATERKNAIAKAIGPIWEADHVWLILIVVILFTAFPPAFAAIMTALNIPLTLMLIGIVLRGSAFMFRKYDSSADEVQYRWSTVFGAASFFTPLIQGVTLGALSTGQIRIVGDKVITNFFAGWLTPFALVCGVFALGLCAFLAATYMTIETEHQRELQNDFRLRALWSGVTLLPIAAVGFFLSKKGAPQIFSGLTSWWGLVLVGSASAFAIVALVSLWRRRFAVARVAAIGQVTLVLTGWSLAQYPNLIIPDVTIFNSSAPAITLRLLIIALLIGAVVLFPSLAFLFYVFKAKDRQPV
jgi:cytochrome d ubiquinol oxidase subunit II